MELATGGEVVIPVAIDCKMPNCYTFIKKGFSSDLG